MAHAYRALREYPAAIDEFEKYETAIGKDQQQVKRRFDEHRRALAERGEQGYWMKCLDEAEKADDLYHQAQCNAKLKNYGRNGHARPLVCSHLSGESLGLPPPAEIGSGL
jgi:hypothetical protein